jgi:hypothetical protein
VIVTTRKKRKIQIKTLNLRSLSESELNNLCQDLYVFSLPNIQEITSEYLRKRLTGYSLLSLAYSESKIVGFSFGDYRNLSLGVFRKIPLIHFGLLIIDRNWRSERVSRYLSLGLVKFVIKKAGPMIFITGFAISAKCSSPVSFYRLQQASLRIGFPKFDNKGELNFLSRSWAGRVLSESISRALNLENIEDFVLLNSNSESGFKLSPEDYPTNSAYEEKVVSFFKKKVIPENEVLFISYAHPVFAL